MGSLNMWFKEVPMQVKDAIIRLKKNKQTYQKGSRKFRSGEFNYMVHFLKKGMRCQAQQHQKT